MNRLHRLAEEFAHGALLAIAAWLLSLPFIRLAKLIYSLIA